MLNFGFIFAIISVILDMVGVNHMAWAYPISLYWSFVPPLLVYDLTYLSVIFMLVYQRYGTNTIHALLAFTITSAIISFVFEPFFEWIGFYKSYTWKHIYSFPIYTSIACLVKFLVDFFEKSRNESLI